MPHIHPFGASIGVTYRRSRRGYRLGGTQMGRYAGVAAALILGFFLVTAPEPAATTVRHAVNSAGHIVH
jgi:hypothetical protein